MEYAFQQACGKTRTHFNLYLHHFLIWRLPTLFQIWALQSFSETQALGFRPREELVFAICYMGHRVLAAAVDSTPSGFDSRTCSLYRIVTMMSASTRLLSIHPPASTTKTTDTVSLCVPLMYFPLCFFTAPHPWNVPSQLPRATHVIRHWFEFR